MDTIGDRDAIRKAALAASPGEWGHIDDTNPHLVTAGKDAAGAYLYVGPDWKDEDGDYMVAAQPRVVLAMLDRMHWLEEAVRDHLSARSRGDRDGEEQARRDMEGLVREP